MKFLDIVGRAEYQATFARLIYYGPQNPKAYNFLEPEIAKLMPTYPENLKVAHMVDFSWWDEESAGDAEALPALAAIVRGRHPQSEQETENCMNPMKSLLAPQAIAVVGASQRGGRGASVIANLRDCGFSGRDFRRSIRATRRCTASNATPASPICPLASIASLRPWAPTLRATYLKRRTPKVFRPPWRWRLDSARAAFGEARALRLKALAAKGMCICGPNCFGYINVKDRVAAFSGPIAKPLRPGSVAIVSQSGGLGATAFTPLMADRRAWLRLFRLLRQSAGRDHRGFHRSFCRRS